MEKERAQDARRNEGTHEVKRRVKSYFDVSDKELLGE